MKRSKFIIMLLFIVSCNSEEQDHEGHQEKAGIIYTCPMHPEIVRSKPGQCPICNMKLVEKVTEGDSITDDQLSLLNRSVNAGNVSNLQTVKPLLLTRDVELSMPGLITYDQETRYTVSARVSGRIEKLFVRSPYQRVQKGDKLMEIYSKELINEQENLLYLLKVDPSDKLLIEAAETRLLLSGLSGIELDELKSNGKVLSPVTLFSPVTGHLHINDLDVSNSMDQDMQEKNPAEIRLGRYVKKGQPVFYIYDTQNVWALLKIDPKQSEFIKAGDSVEITLKGQPGKLKGMIRLVEPKLRPGELTATAIMPIKNNSGEILPGSLIESRVWKENQTSLWIPVSTIIHLGKQDIVFVKVKDSFVSRQVILGMVSQDLVPVLSGLSASDVLALHANLMVDSESFIQEQE